MKVLLVVGHTKNKDKGAFSPFLNTTEFEYNKSVVEELKKLSNYCVSYEIYTHSLQDYYKRQKALADYVNQRDYDLILEFHFNSSLPTANGVECLYWFNSKKGKDTAKIFSKGISEKYGVTMRGEQGSRALVNKNDRGYYFVYLPKAVAVIIEPFFGSNEESLKFKDVKEYAKVLHNIISNL